VVLWLCVPVCLCLSGTVCPWSTQIYPGWIQSISVVLWSGRWRAGLSCKVVAERYCGSQPTCAPARCSLRRGTVPTVVQSPLYPQYSSGPVPTVVPGVQWPCLFLGIRDPGSAQHFPTGGCQVWVSGRGQVSSAVVPSPPLLGLRRACSETNTK